MTLDDALYSVETWQGTYDSLPLTDLQLTQLAEYFLRNLEGNHSVPGAVYHQMQGEMSYFREHRYLTHRQRRWLMHSLKDHLGDIRT